MGVSIRFKAAKRCKPKAITLTQNELIAIMVQLENCQVRLMKFCDQSPPDNPELGVMMNERKQVSALLQRCRDMLAEANRKE